MKSLHLLTGVMVAGISIEGVYSRYTDVAGEKILHSTVVQNNTQATTDTDSKEKYSQVTTFLLNIKSNRKYRSVKPNNHSGYI